MYAEAVTFKKRFGLFLSEIITIKSKLLRDPPLKKAAVTLSTFLFPNTVTRNLKFLKDTGKYKTIIMQINYRFYKHCQWFTYLKQIEASEIYRSESKMDKIIVEQTFRNKKRQKTEGGRFDYQIKRKEPGSKQN